MQDRAAVTLGARLLAHLESVHAGQAEVEDHHVGVVTLDVVERDLAVLHPDHVVTLTFERAYKREGDVLLVLDHQYTRHGGEHRGRDVPVWCSSATSCHNSQDRWGRGRGSHALRNRHLDRIRVVRARRTTQQHRAGSRAPSTSTAGAHGGTDIVSTASRG